MQPQPAARARNPALILNHPAAAPWRTWLLLLGLTLLWDAGGADLPVMQLIGNSHGFPLRDQWLLSRVLHDGVRQLAVVLYVVLLLWSIWPAAWRRGPAAWWTLGPRERLTIAILVTLSLVAVNLVKNASQTSCPWDLQAFGGPAQYVTHWQAGLGDGGSGRCFPGGHASSAFAFFALCLPWLAPPAGTARDRTAGHRWLGLIVLTGLMAGTVQTLRGAHYPSHTLWTLLICSSVSLTGWFAARRWLEPVPAKP